MKKTVACLLSLLISVSVFAFSEEIDVKVTEIGSTEGNIVIGLYEEGNFTETDKELMGAVLEADSSQLDHTFKEVPPGEYAISLYHDKNENGKHDKNLMGIPTEGYGFSKNVYNWYGGAPGFDKASFTLEPGETKNLEIKVKNWPPV